MGMFGSDLMVEKIFEEERLINNFIKKYLYKTVKVRGIREINACREALFKAGFMSESESKQNMKRFGYDKKTINTVFKKSIEEKYFFYIKLNNEYWIKNTPVGVMNNRFIDVEKL